MSVPVAIEALFERVAEFGVRTFLVTVGPDARPHVTSALVRIDGDRLVVGAGRTSRANTASSPGVTLLWPPAASGEYSLLVDGAGEASDVDGGTVSIAPTRAVLHRVAGAPGDGPSCIRVLDPD